MKSKAACYIRVSTTDQAESGYSLQAQEALCRQYCADHDYSVVGVYADEGKSASKALDKRTELLRLVSDCELGKIDIIVFKDITRWSRSASAFYKVQDRLDKCKVPWVAIEQPYLETVTPTGRFQVQIMLGTAQLEAEQTGQRIKFVQEAEIKRGHFPFPPHNAPTGYTTEKREDGNYLVIDEQTAPIIRTIFRTFQHALNLQRCVEAVREEHGIEYAHTTINRILRNPVYKGEFRGVQGFCPPIIEPAEFDRLQRPKRVFTASRHKGQYIFSSLVRCAHCGRTMYGLCSDEKYFMYQCKGGCHNTITQRELEQKVLGIVSPMFQDYRVIVKQRQRDNKTISEQRSKLERKKARLTELYVDDLIDRAEFDRRRNEIDSKLTELEPVPELPYISTDFNGMYDNLSNEKKAVFWRAFIDHITVDRDRNVGVVYHTAKVLAERLSTLNEVVPTDENFEK